MLEPAPSSRGGAAATVAWCLAALLLYALMGADVFYKTDGPDLLRLLQSGERHPWHVGYLPALGAFRQALQLCGLELTLIAVGNLFSAAGMALGVGGFHAGLRRLGVPAGEREIATTLLAFSPAALLFATVVEFHAPLMAAVGWAFWWTAVQVRRPTWWGMATLGAMTHVAFTLHSSSIVLPAWLLAFFMAHRWGQATHAVVLRSCLVAGGAHAALFLVMPRLFPAFYGWHSDWTKAAEMEASIGRPQTLDFLPEIVVQEWLLPLLPVSVLCLLAVRRRELRPQFAAFALAWLPYIYICVRQLVFEPEYGAYMLPLVPAAALLTAQALPPRIWPAAVLCSLVAAGIVRHRAIGPELHETYDHFTAAVAEAAAGKPYLLLVCRHDETAICLARLEPGTFESIRTQAVMPRERYDDAMRVATIQGLRLLSQGKVLLITEGAREWLRDPARLRLQEKAALAPMANEEFAGPLVLRDLEGACRLEVGSGVVGGGGSEPGRVILYRVQWRD